MPTKTYQAWAIKGRENCTADRKILLWTVESDEALAKERFLHEWHTTIRDSHPWSHWYHMGFRCVRVEVKEV